MSTSPPSATRRSFLARLSALLGAAGAQAAPSRAAAPPRRIVLLETCVAGTAYYRAQEVRAKLDHDQPLTLRRQPDNRYDELAIEVYSRDGAKLGYVPRVDNQALASLMDAGKILTAEIAALDDQRIAGEVEIWMRVVMLD